MRRPRLEHDPVLVTTVPGRLLGLSGQYVAGWVTWMVGMGGIEEMDIMVIIEM